MKPYLPVLSFLFLFHFLGCGETTEESSFVPTDSETGTVQSPGGIPDSPPGTRGGNTGVEEDIGAEGFDTGETDTAPSGDAGDNTPDTAGEEENESGSEESGGDGSWADSCESQCGAPH